MSRKFNSVARRCVGFCEDFRHFLVISAWKMSDQISRIYPGYLPLTTTTDAIFNIWRGGGGYFGGCQFKHGHRFSATSLVSNYHWVEFRHPNWDTSKPQARGGERRRGSSPETGLGHYGSPTYARIAPLLHETQLYSAREPGRVFAVHVSKVNAVCPLAPALSPPLHSPNRAHPSAQTLHGSSNYNCPPAVPHLRNIVDISQTLSCPRAKRAEKFWEISGISDFGSDDMRYRYLPWRLRISW